VSLVAAADLSRAMVPRHAGGGKETREKAVSLRVSRRIGYSAGGATCVRSHSSTMEEAALAELYRSYAPAIFVHCRRLLGSQAAARDAMQEAFVRMMVKAPAQLKGQEALRYVYRVATNVCLNQLREQKVHDRATPAIVARSAGAATGETRHANRQFAEALLDRCDETGTAIAIMHHVDGLSQVEIARTLGITRRTVFNRLKKIEKLAHDLLEDKREDKIEDQ